MFEKIPAPVKGQPARASWGASLTNRVNELCAMSPARGLARDGLTGTGFAPLPTNRRTPRAALPPWTFRCTEDPETHERTGGWYNCQLQIGYSCNIRGGADRDQSTSLITGCDQTEDGSYYVEVDLQNETARIVKGGGGESEEDEPQSDWRSCGRNCSSDYRNNKIRTWIGTVRNGVQTEGIYMVPVIYKFT